MEIQTWWRNSLEIIGIKSDEKGEAMHSWAEELVEDGTRLTDDDLRQSLLNQRSSNPEVLNEQEKKALRRKMLVPHISTSSNALNTSKGSPTSTADENTHFHQTSPNLHPNASIRKITSSGSSKSVRFADSSQGSPVRRPPQHVGPVLESYEIAMAAVAKAKEGRLLPSNGVNVTL